jgi:hypothetical protein
VLIVPSAKPATSRRHPRFGDTINNTIFSFPLDVSVYDRDSQHENQSCLKQEGCIIWQVRKGPRQSVRNGYVSGPQNVQLVLGFEMRSMRSLEIVLPHKNLGRTVTVNHFNEPNHKGSGTWVRVEGKCR